MRFLVDRPNFLPVLKQLYAVAGNGSNPVLSSIHIRAAGDKVILTATDMAMTATRIVSANVEDHGETCIPAANLVQVVGQLPNDVIVFDLGDNNRMNVKCQRSSYKLSGMEATEFPPAPTPVTGTPLTIDAADLRKIIDQTWFSVAPDDNRYGLNGAHLDAIDTPAGRMLRMVGTDGNRLSWSQAPFTGTLAIGRRMLLPRKPLAEVRKMIDGLSGPVEIRFGERAAEFAFDGTTVHTRLLEAEFPAYKEVLPKEFKRTVTLDRAAFAESLRRVSIFASDTSHSVRFAFSPDGLVLTARKLDAGDAREECACDLAGEPITMGFNAKFMQEVIVVLPAARVTLKLGDTLSPCIVQPFGEDDENALFVIMPVRLD
jgi:DNA polymerase-3 subunit beta